MKTIIIVPTIRESCILKFLDVWRDQFKNCLIYIIEDNQYKSFKIEENNVIHFCHKDIEKDLGRHHWIINRKDCSVWAYGAYRAYRENADMIVVLSDDCYPVEGVNFLEKHWKKLNLKVSNEWLNPLFNIYPRGYPNKERTKEVVLNMGLWSGIPDVDGVTQLSGYNKNFQTNIDLVVPKGVYFALSDMNIAFKPSIIPYMYEFEKDRFGDIWMGIRLKRYCDENNLAITIGNPLIEHIRASNPFVNIQKESLHLEENETFYLHDIPLHYQEKINVWMSLFN